MPGGRHWFAGTRFQVPHHFRATHGHSQQCSCARRVRPSTTCMFPFPSGGAMESSAELNSSRTCWPSSRKSRFPRSPARTLPPSRGRQGSETGQSHSTSRMSGAVAVGASQRRFQLAASLGWAYQRSLNPRPCRIFAHVGVSQSMEGCFHRDIPSARNFKRGATLATIFSSVSTASVLQFDESCLIAGHAAPCTITCFSSARSTWNSSRLVSART